MVNHTQNNYHTCSYTKLQAMQQHVPRHNTRPEKTLLHTQLISYHNNQVTKCIALRLDCQGYLELPFNLNLL